MTEDVELPGGARVGTEDAPLEADAVHEVPDGRLDVRQVGARLVVCTTHDFHASLRDEATEKAAVLRSGVPVGLQVVDLGKHKAVVRIIAGKVEMRLDELESGMLEGRPW